MRIEADIKLDFKDVLIRPKRSTLSSRKEVVLDRVYQFRNSEIEWTGVPVMAANMDTVGTFEMAVELAKAHVFTCIHKHYSVDDWAEWQATADGKAAAPYVAVSTGTGAKDLERVVQVVKKCPAIKHICIDVANGYSQHFVEFVVKCRKQFPRHTLIAGNVVTGEMTEELILSGADIVKVGIGPGSVCTTRKIAGVGYPQLSAIIECADAAHGLGGHVIADGGCTCPGDVAKAFGAGADYVMLGGMFAGHDEGAGQVIEVNGEYFKEFYGMSSDTAMKKHAGGVAEYRASEGKTVKVPYRGPVKNTIQSVLGGLRSACTYVGALTLKELSKRTTFVRCSQTVNQIFSSEKHAPPPKTSDGPVTKKQKTG